MSIKLLRITALTSACTIKSEPQFLPSETPATWNDAQQQCKQWGGDLASVNSLEELQYVQQALENEDLSNYWLGLRGKDEAKKFEWSDKSIMKFNGFEKGRPDNFNGW